MIWPMEKSAACPRVFPTITSPARSVNQRSCRFRFSVLIPERAVPIPRRIVPDPPPPPSGNPSKVDSGGIPVPVCIACNAGGFRHRPNQCSTISDTRVIPDPPDLCKQFLCHLCRVGSFLNSDPEFRSEIPDEFDTPGEFIAGITVAVMLVPDLHAMLLRDEDVGICLERDGPPEQDALFHIDLLNLDPVCVGHLPERGIDLLVHRAECLRYALPGNPEKVRY